VRVEVSGDSYVLEPDGEGGGKLTEVPEGMTAKQRACDSVFGALPDLRMSDVHPADAVEPDWDALYVCELENLTYLVQTAEGEDVIYVGLSAEGPEVRQVEVAPGETDEQLKEKEALLLAADEADEFNSRHARWVYKVSRWSGEDLRMPLSDLLEEPEEEAAEEGDSEAAAPSAADAPEPPAEAE
jgi:hypothetical protein